MTKYCLTEDPIDQTEIYFGFFIFALFFTVLIKCNNHHRDMQRQQKKAKSYEKKLINQNKKKTKFVFNSKLQEEQNIQQQNPQLLQGSRSDQRKNEKIMVNVCNHQETLKRLSQFAYKYIQNEHQMMKIYRSRKQIEDQRQLYINRAQDKQTTNQQKIQNEQKNVNKIQSSGNFKKVNSFENIKQVKTSKPQKQLKSQKSPIKIAQQKNLIPVVQNTQNNNKLNLFNNLPNLKQQKKTETQKNKKIQDKGANKMNSGTLFTIKQSNNENDNEIKPNKKQLIFPNINQNQANTVHHNKKQQSKSGLNEINLFQPTTIMPKQKQEERNLFPSLKNKNEAIQTKTSVQKKEEKIIEASAIKSPQQYLDVIIKYSKTFGIKTQIKTNINNLGGAKSDPRDLWAFATSYIKTINPHNHDEAQTFSYKIWEAIVQKFIKNTNIKDGFQRMPPKQKSKQVQKTSINTYVILINIFRAMGHESIWLGVFGNTLRTLQFLFKRTQPLRSWKNLELIEAKYVALDGDVSSKYQSRIDFLIYFLLGLTTFDPVEVFQEVSEKTGEIYTFVDELKKSKYKWSYKQFWCLVDVMRKNKIEAYFKIPFWNNTLTVIYLQMLKNLKQGQMRQFMNLSKWIIKQVKNLTQKLMSTEEGKYLADESQEGPNNKYTFDGQEFMQGTKTLGRVMESRSRQLNLNKWEQFRDKNSIFFYFWRKDL